MFVYYTEYPTGQFNAKDDGEALYKSKAKVVYRESDTENGMPFVMLRGNGVDTPQSEIESKRRYDAEELIRESYEEREDE